MNMRRMNLKTGLASCVALCALAVASPALSATTLTSNDGSIVLEGELVATDDTNYTIRTDFGELIVRRDFVQCAGDGCPVEEEAEEAASSSDVVLRSPDGSVELVGTLVEVTNEDYVIDTTSGRLSVRKEFVNCEGDSCPKIETVAQVFRIATPNAVGQDLIAKIVNDYSDVKGYGVTQAFGAGGNGVDFILGDDSGNEVARVGVDTSQSSDALEAVLNGKAAFALTRQQITPQMLSKALGRPVNAVSDVLQERALGLDALSFVVNNANGVEVVGWEDIQGVLSGRITNWAQLGGADAPITLHMLNGDTEMNEQLATRVMASSGAKIASSGERHENAAKMAESLAADRNGLAVMYRSQIPSGLKALDMISSCNVFYNDDDFSVQTEEYPLVVRWFMYQPKERNSTELASNLFEYLQTNEGQQAVADLGLVGQQLRLSPLKEQGARVISSVLSSTNAGMDKVLKTYFAESAKGKRFSTALRFQTGSSQLDVRALGDLQRISQVVRSPDYAGQELVIFGFSDSYGRFDANLRLSQSRANVVKDLILRENPGILTDADIQTYGLGPVAPVDCNTTPDGRQLNRRVEIWLRPKQG